MHNPVTLRFAFPDDAAVVARLAALDSSRPPQHPVLIAEIDGEPAAALSLSDGAVVADPLRPTAALVDLLRARALQLSDPAGATGSRRAMPAPLPRLLRLPRLRPWLRPGG